jgi:hypothetical protein
MSLSYTIRQPGTPAPSDVTDEIRHPGVPTPGAPAWVPEAVADARQLPAVTVVHINRASGAEVDGFVALIAVEEHAVPVPLRCAPDVPMQIDLPAAWPNRDRWIALIGMAILRAWPAAFGQVPAGPAKAASPVSAPPPALAWLRDARAPAEVKHHFDAAAMRLRKPGERVAAWHRAIAEADEIIEGLRARLDALNAERRAALLRADTAALTRIDARINDWSVQAEIFGAHRANLADLLPERERRETATIASLASDAADIAARAAVIDAAILDLPETFARIAALARSRGALDVEIQRLRGRLFAAEVAETELGVDLQGAFVSSLPARQDRADHTFAAQVKLPGIAPRGEAPPAWAHLPPTR